MHPAPRKAKAAAASKQTQAVTLPPKGKNTFERVFYGDEISDLSDDESDTSEYDGRKRKRARKPKPKKTKSKKRKVSLIRRSPTPEAPEISDQEVEDEYEDENRLFEPPKNIESAVTRQAAHPTELRLVVRGREGNNVNIDLTEFLQPNAKLGRQQLKIDAAGAMNVVENDQESEEEMRIEDIDDAATRSRIRRLQSATKIMSVSLCFQALLQTNFDEQAATGHVVELAEEGTKEDWDESTLNGSGEQQPPMMTNPSIFGSKARGQIHTLRLDAERACLLDLEPDLRNRIYRLVLVAENPIQFSPAKGTARTAGLLRTCHQVYTEGCSILYGENTFHFERVCSKRGSYHDKEWKEVGYKDIRRFLEDIGSTNRSYLRYISFDFSDAAPCLTPLLDASERRFVNDPVVFSILKLISTSGVILERFVVGFTGRQAVHFVDFHFLKAFTGIRCHQLKNSPTWGHSKVNSWLLEKMKEVMEVPQPEDVDGSKQRRTAKMPDEKPSLDTFSRFHW